MMPETELQPEPGSPSIPAGPHTDSLRRAFVGLFWGLSVIGTVSQRLSDDDAVLVAGILALIALGGLIYTLVAISRLMGTAGLSIIWHVVGLFIPIISLFVLRSVGLVCRERWGRIGEWRTGRSE